MPLPKESAGSVSTGTTRSEDLIKAFVGFIQDHRRYLTTDERAKSSKLILELALTSDPEHRYDFLNNELSDFMDEIAPPLTSFGAHDGDGADYGYWFVPSHMLDSDDIWDYLEQHTTMDSALHTDLINMLIRRRREREMPL